MAQVAKEFGVAYPTLIKWKNSKEQKKLQNSKENLDETKKLKLENECLKKKNEILDCFKLFSVYPLKNQ
jgi:hypothetical protein